MFQCSYHYILGIFFLKEIPYNIYNLIHIYIVSTEMRPIRKSNLQLAPDHHNSKLTTCWRVFYLVSKEL